ncbi:MAG: aminotransferase class V-fold PLP-dependent enzyme, partial [Pirellulales bacterium]|nr:aminotransferase class V-fold PLP-dependent enzyme [Pirellulales bacterium]
MNSHCADSTTLDVYSIRRQFPSLARKVDGQTVASFDGPAGSQVPQVVADAVAHCLLHTNANSCGQFATSREVGELANAGHAAAADFLGANDPGEVAFGPNMTTLTLAFSRAIAQTWKSGDEIIVTDSDHDANLTPWVLAAQDADVTVRRIPMRHEDCTLDLDAYHDSLNEKTRLVALGCASNASGTIHPVKQMTESAHAASAEVFLDAVHYA